MNRSIITTMCALLSVLVFSALPSEAAAKKKKTATYAEIGKVVTGFNRYLSQPVWHYPHLDTVIPGTGLAGFSSSGAFDAQLGAGNGNALPLLPGASPSTLLASYVDFEAIAGLGVSPESVPNRVLNVLHDETEVLVDPFGVHYMNVECATDVDDPFTPSRAAPCDPITLGDWNKAWGIMTTTCYDDGSSTVQILATKLRPNRMYTVWADLEAVAEFGALIAAVPVGGVHNVLVTDANGFGLFKRDLEFCLPEDDRGLGIILTLRPGGQNYGGVPVPLLNQEDPTVAFPGYDNAYPGVQIVTHLQFNLGGVLLD